MRASSRDASCDSGRLGVSAQAGRAKEGSRVTASFTLRASVAAPIEVVFDVLTDHRGYANFTRFRSSTLEHEGEPPPNGVGAIRVFRFIGPPIREQVTAFQPPTQFSYEALSGVPARFLLGSVELVPEGERTSVKYRVETAAGIPMPDAMWGAGVRFVLSHLLKSAVKEAERRAAGAESLR